MYARKKRRLALEKSRKQVDDLLRLWAGYENATAYRGIDYRGRYGKRVNQRGEYHYGIISVNALAHWIWDEFEADYGRPTCPKCGNDAVDGDSDIDPDERREGEEDYTRNDLEYKVLHHACGDYACDSCRILFDGEDAFGDEALGHDFVDREYAARIDTSNDCWVFQSPYFTLVQFCSPCAPGAGHLQHPCPTGVRTFCLGPDFFEDGKAPYPIWSVKTGKLVKPKRK